MGHVISEFDIMFIIYIAVRHVDRNEMPLKISVLPFKIIRFTSFIYGERNDGVRLCHNI